MKTLDFVSNERVIEQLGVFIDSKRFPHALIIEGEQGLGKRTLARKLAQALVCRGEETPCGECAQCKKAADGVHPDIFEYSASGAANSFHVDVVRNVINDAYVKPNEAEKKVYILGNADCMSSGAQNALLKVLEEPPSYVVFILTVKSKSIMLETILSRSVVVSLEGVDIDKGAKYICDNCEEIDFNSAKSALETFNGNIGKTIEGLNDERTKELTKTCCDICKALVNSNEYQVMCSISAFQKDRSAVVFACDFMKNIFRDALVFESKSLISGQSELAQLLNRKFGKKKLIDLINVCDKLKSMALMNSNNALLITKLCYSLMEAVGK